MSRQQISTLKGPQTAFAIPVYIQSQLRARAIGQDTGLRGVVLAALQSIGVHVEPIDLVRDERLARPEGRGPQAGFALPLYVMIQLRALAIRQGCTLRYLILTAVQAIGVRVEQVDLVADKRQRRPKGTRAHYAGHPRVKGGGVKHPAGTKTREPADGD